METERKNSTKPETAFDIYALVNKCCVRISTPLRQNFLSAPRRGQRSGWGRAGLISSRAGWTLGVNRASAAEILFTKASSWSCVWQQSHNTAASPAVGLRQSATLSELVIASLVYFRVVRLPPGDRDVGYFGHKLKMITSTINHQCINRLHRSKWSIGSFKKWQPTQFSAATN